MRDEGCFMDVEGRTRDDQIDTSVLDERQGLGWRVDELELVRERRERLGVLPRAIDHLRARVDADDALERRQLGCRLACKRQ